MMKTLGWSLFSCPIVAYLFWIAGQTTYGYVDYIALAVMFMFGVIILSCYYLGFAATEPQYSSGESLACGEGCNLFLDTYFWMIVILLAGLTSLIGLIFVGVYFVLILFGVDTTISAIISIIFVIICFEIALFFDAGNCEYKISPKTEPVTDNTEKKD